MPFSLPSPSSLVLLSSRNSASMVTWRHTSPLYCLVPVRRFPSPSRSIHFGEVSEANGRETLVLSTWAVSLLWIFVWASHFCLDHMTQNVLAARNNEAWGLGESFTWDWNYSNLSGKILIFWIVAGLGRWSLTIGGRIWRFGCDYTCHHRRRFPVN